MRSHRLSRFPSPGRLCAALALLILGGVSPVRAQQLGFAAGVPTGASTVRQNEFRSRWADYQVDRRPVQTTAQETEGPPPAQSGLLDLFSHYFNDHFRNGPLQVRADLAVGYEFTNESNLRIQNPDGVETSPFVSPSLGVFYNREVGPATVSARYSVGYVYYLDQSYLAANHNGGILSQTFGLDVGVEGGRTTLASSTSASSGNGNDIQSGTQRDLLTVSEGLSGAYTVTEFTQVGATASVSYSSYSGGENGTDTDNLYTAGTLYGDYVITGKTRLRLEFDAGDQSQGQGGGGGNTSSRSYYQLLLHANYIPSPKITLDGGVGYGYQEDSAVQGRQSEGFRPVYTLTASYVPTEKTSVYAYFGFGGIDVEPSFSLRVQYQPRPNTAVAFSAYQNSGFSTFVQAQNLVTRGALGSVQQRFFEKVSVSLSSGAEQSRGYASSGTGTGTGFEDPYYFASISLLWQINSSLALQSYYRGYTGQFGGTANDKGLQSRASMSLRLTF